MRIAFFLSQFPCITETFVLDQITGLIDRGHQVAIFARERGEQWQQHADVQRYELLKRTCFHAMPSSRIRRVGQALALLATRYRTRPGTALRALNPARFGVHAWSLSSLFWHHRIVDEGPYDVIHCHFGPMGHEVIKLRDAGFLAGPLITTFYGYDVSNISADLGRSYYRHLFASADLLLSVSHSLRRNLLQMGCSEEKVIVHRLGINVSRFTFQARTPTSHDEARLLTVARLVEKKGIEYALRAVAEVAGEGLPIEYRIVGDGSLRRDLEGLAARLGISQQVRFEGWLEQASIVKQLQWADLLMSPSVTARDGDQEGTPVVIMEAMARGLPVLSTFHSGIPEVVADGQCGMLVPERDVNALANALRELLRNRSRWPEMGEIGRNIIEQRFSIDLLNDQLVDIYQRLS